MQLKNKLTLSMLSALFAISCSKKEIQYEDPNGDIGSDDPDGQDIEVKDSRLNTPDYYHLKPSHTIRFY